MTETIRKIEKLPQSLSNKIAAGEVVDRPASAVKELVENAIDAEASHISIVIKQGGKELIQVVDDGFGMSEPDLELAFERHATSKIKTIDDLESIESLGFRGEALPSIASVAQVEIKSRIDDNVIGHMLRLEGGKIVKKSKVACPKGTNIEIKNLFYNTPARRNFLRSDSGELQHIITVLKRFFLAYPEIAFELYSNDEKLIGLKSCGIERRAEDVFGKEWYPYLLTLHESLGGIELSGFISKPEKVRKSRGNQYIFLNGRPIQDKALNHAIFKGYSNLIGPGEFPTFCLFLEMDPKIADVNVHPSKMEVRFSNEKSLYYFFMSSVRKVLDAGNALPKFSYTGNTIDFSERNDAENNSKEDIAEEFKYKSKFMGGPVNKHSNNHDSNQLSLAYIQPQRKEVEAETYAEPAQYNDDIDVRFWQIHKRYILSEIKSGMVIIDQHVAHERILFERILKVLKKEQSAYGQKLLFPHTLALTTEDLLFVKDINDLLQNIGFNICEFSGNTIVIDAIPSDVKVGKEGQVILDIIDYYKENPLKKFDPYEKLAAAFACKNAIKSGEILTHVQMHALIDQLFACETPYYCPHGRPIIIKMDLDELDRKFKRIS